MSRINLLFLKQTFEFSNQNRELSDKGRLQNFFPATKLCANTNSTQRREISLAFTTIGPPDRGQQNNVKAATSFSKANKVTGYSCGVLHTPCDDIFSLPETDAPIPYCEKPELFRERNESTEWAW